MQNMLLKSIPIHVGRASSFFSLQIRIRSGDGKLKISSDLSAIRNDLGLSKIQTIETPKKKNSATFSGESFWGWVGNLGHNLGGGLVEANRKLCDEIFEI